MHEPTSGRLRRWSHGVLAILLTVFASGVLLLWAWNTIAVGLFQAPAFAFKHALAVQAAIASLVAQSLVLARHLRRADPDGAAATRPEVDRRRNVAANA
ncbi:MAG TPA: hypothetical protein VIK47_01570 [Kiloniellales bacterium]